ncbi:MAG TPA: hypothetical protein VNW46_06220 [Gemmatimonadaceae bacterium]|jgi:hypothetical protein|nr:hypothetical protein [Gemmatimonadaceae bacterium]
MADVVGAGAAARGEASAPRDPGWAVLLLALLAVVLIPSAPFLQVMLPVTQPVLLLVPVLAVCALLGWAADGSPWLVIVWVTVAVVTLRAFPSPMSALAGMAKGWAILVAALFGLLSLAAGRHTRFFPRALAAVALALTIAGLAIVASGVSGKTLARTVSHDITVRPNGALAWWHETTGLPEFQQMVKSVGSDSTTAANVQQIEQAFAVVPIQWGQQLFFAFLALESLAMLALGWGLYHRISRTRIGPPLARLREFRFSDELVWGVIVGIVFIVLPLVTHGLPTWSVVGYNLVLFFGTLYALRGLGVFAWFVRSGRLSGVALVAIAVVVGLLAVTSALAPALALIGLGDTWEDWRAKPKPTT